MSTARSRLFPPIAALSVLASCGGNGTLTSIGASANFYVDAGAGSDANAGSSGAPFKTITKALSVAVSGNTVRVLPGRYDAANGETFPLQLPAGVALIGDEANKGGGSTPTAIFGGGTNGFGQTTTINPGGSSAIAGFTITDSATNGTGLALRNGSITVRNNRIVNAVFVGIYITNSSSNHFISGNLIDHDGSLGLGFISGGSGSRVENNTIANSIRGVEYDSPGGDLGGGAGGSAGGNVLSCNTASDVWTISSVTINASNNRWDHVPPTKATTGGGSGGIDFYNGGGTATLIATGATLAPSPCP